MVRLLLAAVAVALGVSASGAAAGAPLYTLAATKTCLTRLPNAVAGLPPTTPPRPPPLFVYALAHDDVSTWGGIGPRPRAHRQLGIWNGTRNYQGILLSFFKNVPDARASLKTLAWLYGGKRVRNVVVTWDQKAVPSASMQNTVLGCLSSGAVVDRAAKRPPPATLGTFAGGWGGHDRGLSITPTGRGLEGGNAGCCFRSYRLTFQILSVSGSLTRAVAVYRVRSFKRYDAGVRMTIRAGELGKLVLKDGIVTNTLTGDNFCSGPAWGATGACGA